MTAKPLSDANSFLQKFVSDGQGYVARPGAVESEGVDKYLSGKGFRSWDVRFRKLAGINAGIWPNHSTGLNSFFEIYAEAMRGAGALAVWPPGSLSYQMNFQKWFPKHALLPMAVLDPVSYYSDLGINSWTRKLNGKNLLVVTSMDESVGTQASSLHQIHESGLFLPRKVTTLRPPQTSGKVLLYEKSMDLLDKSLEGLKDGDDFDFALVSAGGYGTIMQSKLWERGIPSIYVGGALQLLFGIMGNRWREEPRVLRYRNEYWIDRPTEKPPPFSFLIEGSTYW